MYHSDNVRLSIFAGQQFIRFCILTESGALFKRQLMPDPVTDIRQVTQRRTEIGVIDPVMQFRLVP